MRSKISLLIATFILFSTTFFPFNGLAFNNDVNNDGFVDSVYKDSLDNGKQFYAYKIGSNGNRVGVLNAYAITPYWNKQPNGIEYVRVFTDTVGVQKELNALSNTVYPEAIYNKFVIGDTGARITAIGPKSSGNYQWNFAKMMADLLTMTTVGKIIEYVSIIASAAGTSTMTDQDSYISTYFTSRSNWQTITGGKTDLPSSITAYSAHLYKDYGFTAKFEYSDITWSSGSTHSVTPTGNIKYVMTLASNGLPYGWFSGTFSVPHKSYGY